MSTGAATAGKEAVPAGKDAVPAGKDGAAGQVSVVPGIARYHTADCILIRFLSPEDLETLSLAEAEASGCVPCRACRPEKASA